MLLFKELENLSILDIFKDEINIARIAYSSSIRILRMMGKLDKLSNERKLSIISRLIIAGSNMSQLFRFLVTGLSIKTGTEIREVLALCI